MQAIKTIRLKRALLKLCTLLKLNPLVDLDAHMGSQHLKIKEFPLEFSPHLNFMILASTY